MLICYAAATDVCFAAQANFIDGVAKYIITTSRFRNYKKYKRMPDYTPPVIDDLRRDEHGECLTDELPCWDGSVVRRNEDLDCAFDKCPARKVRFSVSGLS